MYFYPAQVKVVHTVNTILHNLHSTITTGICFQKLLEGPH